MFLNIRYRGAVSGVGASPTQDVKSPICQWFCSSLLIGMILLVSVALFVQNSAIGYILGCMVTALALFIVFCMWMRSLYKASLKRIKVKARKQDRRAHHDTVIRIPPETSDLPATAPRADQTVSDEPPPYESLAVKGVPDGHNDV